MPRVLKFSMNCSAASYILYIDTGTKRPVAARVWEAWWTHAKLHSATYRTLRWVSVQYYCIVFLSSRFKILAWRQVILTYFMWFSSTPPTNGSIMLQIMAWPLPSICFTAHCSLIVWLFSNSIICFSMGYWISTQVFLGFLLPISKYWDGSQDSKLPLHASHVALPT